MSDAPLADQLRPKNIAEIVGQEQILQKDGLIAKLLENYSTTKFFPSLVFWGPPGCGKTTLARAISAQIGKAFFEFSAVNSSVKEIEKVVPASPKQTNQKSLLTVISTKTDSPIVFIDEIHRFNKAQQDALLPLVEQGKIILFGATTENPSFEVIGPLLSRTRVVILNQLTEEQLHAIIKRALVFTKTKIDQTAENFLVQSSNGDARSCINLFEIAANLATDKIISQETVKNALQKSNLYFDLKGEEFYNTISALHKSIRGSDPDAALYWLARMLEAGQDPLYIARRLIRASTEDIGIKDPQALVIATAAFNAANMLGMPECNLALAEATVYLAKSPKSNQLYMAYGRVAEDVHKFGNLPVPMNIRNAVTKLMKEVGYGKNYNYHHSPTGEKDTDDNYMPDKLKGKKYL